LLSDLSKKNLHSKTRGRSIKMLHINKNITSKTMGKEAVRWQILTIAFLSLLIGVFCFAGSAVAAVTLTTDFSQNEGNAGTTIYTFTVNITPEVGAVSVDYATSDVSANAGSDYLGASGTLHFAAGVTTGTIDITVNGDTVVENDETFNVTLTNFTGPDHLILDGTGVGTITNDDQFSISVDSPKQAGEGFNVQFVVTLNSDVDVAASVTLNPSDGTATTADSDYNDTPLPFVFPVPSSAGATHTFNVPTTADPKVEGDETFSIAVTSLPPYWDGNVASGIGTIINDDTATLSISGPASQPESVGNCRNQSTTLLGWQRCQWYRNNYQ
jgi:Calx-beta domain-containing protein